MKNRRWITRIHGCALAAALAITMAGCTSDAGSQGTPGPIEPIPTIVGLTFIPNIQFAPFYIADKNGFYSDDIKVTLRHHGSDEGLFTALAAGDENFVVAGGDEILQARSQGIEIVAVASYYVRYPARVIVPKDSSISSVKDLRGQRVGLPGRFGENWFALLIALKQAGLTEKDVTIVEIGYTQLAALSTDKVDAVIGFANSDVINFATAGFDIKVIDPEVPLVSICLATTSFYAQSHPYLISTLIDAMRQGMESALKDPDNALAVAADYIPSFRGEILDSAKAVLPATSALFTDSAGTVSPPLDPDQWKKMAEAMISVDLIPEGTDPAKAFTNEYRTAG